MAAPANFGDSRFTVKRDGDLTPISLSATRSGHGDKRVDYLALPGRDNSGGGGLR